MTQNTSTPVDAALQASTRAPRDTARLDALGGFLMREFETYERDRQPAELRWAKHARQFLGQYDPDVAAALDPSRSKAYPKLTRVKCVSMLSRLMNLLFQSSEKNWSIQPSHVPSLDDTDLQMLLTNLQLSQDPNAPLDDAMIELAIMEFAKERSNNLEREIADQLQEIGGSRQVDYVALCRKVMMSAIIYGMGVLKGPFIRSTQLRTWERDATGAPVAKSYMAMRPQFEFVPIWDYYPDMSAKYLHQMDGQFQRIVMAHHQVRELADRDDFFGDVIKQYLRDNPKGNYRQRTFESELKAMGVHNNVNDQSGRKYELLVWDGFIKGRDLQAAGVEMKEEQLTDRIEAIVWLIDGKVIKADMNPWVRLGIDQKVNSYHHFIFEEDESTITGNGLPNIMRDSQMAICSATRMVMDNASVVCGQNLEVNLDLVDASQDLASVHAYKIWYRRGIGADASMPAVRQVSIDSHVPELLKLIELFRSFADTETFVNAATGGDMAKMPSEPFRTASGASLLKSDAALPFKDVVRNFDLFTQSVIGSLVAFNAQFNPKPTIRGDHQVIPRGSTSLMAKEVRGMVLDNLSQTLTQEDKRYLNSYDLLRERLAARDVDTTSGILCSKEEAKRRDEAATAAQRAQQQSTDELLAAEVRKSLAEAVKALSQADKNAAGAESAAAKTAIEVANASLAQLQGGLNDEQPANGAAAAGGAGAKAGDGGSAAPAKSGARGRNVNGGAATA